MEENKKIMVKKADGTVKEADILLYFTLEETKKDYVIYTFNESTDEELELINAAIVSKNGDELEFNEITDDEEWKKVKDVMRDVISDNRE